MRTPRFPLVAALLATVALRASSYDALWSDPALEQRITDGIRRHRMSEATVRCVGPDGGPLRGASVRVEQTRHAFLFGANCFMLGGFPTAGENSLYEQAYLRLFNYATVPFYWSDLEPEQGRPRFAADSAPMHRRPPPDAVVAFCRAHGVAMKGHPLVWHQWYPKWRPEDPREVMPRIERRIAEIATRYAGDIQRWEVVNEPMERDLHAEAWCNLPPGYVLESLRLAALRFPAANRLMLNEATAFSWQRFEGDRSPFYRLIRDCLDRGARIDEIGMQLHIFNEKAWRQLLDGQTFRPADLLRVLDRYADFGVPIGITELTLPTAPASAEGERLQAVVTRNLYRLWFSHPRVNAISWWNVVDNTAAKGEDRMLAGLLRRDFTPKPSYEALDRLLNGEWRTRLEARCSDSGTAGFRGFHGDYRVTVESGGRTATGMFRLEPGGANVWMLRL